MPTKPNHQSYDRLLVAAKSITPAISATTSGIAKWLNVSPQLVNNWVARGVSREGALLAQEKAGFSATWIRKGTGPERVTGAALAVPQPKKGAHLHAPDELETKILHELQRVTRSDKEKLLKELRVIAKDRQAVRDEIMEQIGIKEIQARAAHSVRERRESTTVHPGDPRLKQRSLLDEERNEK